MPRSRRDPRKAARLRSSRGIRRAAQVILALAPASMVLMGGCGDAPEAIERGAGTVATPGPGGTAVLAENSDMGLPMPLLTLTVIDGDLQDIMFMALYRTAWRDGRAVFRLADESPMALARRYEFVGGDSASVRFHLRSDVRWSDGEPITAHDVVWTYEVMSDPELPSPRRDYVEQLDSLVAEDDSTVTFHFERRYPEMLFHAGHGIAPRHVYAGTPLAQLASHPSLLQPAENLVVSGAYRVGGWERGQRIVLVRNPHFRPQPYLDRIVIRVIPDETTRLVELRTGNIDGMRVSSPSNVPALQREAPEIRLEQIGRRFSEFVAYNPQVEAFGNPEIRRALGLAIDIPAIIAALDLTGYADPAASVYSPIFVELRDPELKPLSYDAARAAQILEAAGWTDGDGDGIREKNGDRFSFTLLTNAGNQRRADLATLLQNYWSRIGVEARLQQLEFQTFMSRVTEKQFEAVVYGWQVSLSPDISGMWAPEAMHNIVSYRSPELQRLMTLALSQEGQEQAVPHWKAAARQIAADQPYSWLYYMDQVVALRSRLRGTEIDTFGMYQNVWEWWIPREQQRREEISSSTGAADSGSAPPEARQP